jgi:protein-disulfide isomerase
VETTLIEPIGAGDHVSGPVDAPVTLVEYGDFECVYCRIAHPVVKACNRQLGSMLRFAFRHFPISEIHPHARLAAQAAEAAAAQGRFWEMHDVLLVYQHALKHEDLVGYARALGLDVPRVARELRAGTYAARVSADFRSGLTSGVNATPTFFVNGARYDGSWTDIQSFIRALRDAASLPLGAGPLDADAAQTP